MKKHNAVFSLFLVIVIICISIAPTFALDNSYASNKLDEGLVAKLNEIDDNEKITVSIWFDDVDKELVKDKLYETYNGKKNADVYQKSEELLFGEVCEIPMNYTKDYLSYAKEYYKDITQEDFQYISERKREVYKDEYKKHNGNMINKVTDALDSTSIEKVYVSKYAPNVELELSKEEIFEVSELQNVDEIYFVNPRYNSNLNKKNTTEDVDEEIEETPYDYSFYNVTGLATGRDAFGLNGAGMKVGVVELNGRINIDYLQNYNIIELTSDPNDDISNHVTLVAGSMISNNNDFTGAIPQAQLYYAYKGGEKACSELLLEQGVTAINCSFSHKIEYNTYGDMAKWYDHISIQHNVHLILAAANKGNLGVPYTNTAYNAIVVGNCNNDGVIADDSSYSSGNEMSFKPDIVAPGHISTPIAGFNGTSFSAPLVTSAVIQLSQASPILAANPTLMKSLLLSSSSLTQDMLENETVFSTVDSDAIALSRQYGAGMLNLSKAYETFITKGNYITGSFSNNSTGVVVTRNITKVANKTLRFCLTWDKYNTVNGEHDSNNANSPALDNLSLTVVTPSGITYTSNYMYDNKQVITFNATENGEYSIRVYRQGTANSNNNIDYAITYSASAY